MVPQASVLTIGELSDYLRIPRSTLYKLAQEGEIPGQKVGRRWRFLRKAVDRWLEEARGPRSGAPRSEAPRPEAPRPGAARPGAPRHDAVLLEIVRRLVEAYQPQRIYLFGSKARGDAGPDSDYDLLVVVPDDAPPERRRSRLGYERLWGVSTAADVVVWTAADFDSRMHLRASLPATVLREGTLLYAA